MKLKSLSLLATDRLRKNWLKLQKIAIEKEFMRGQRDYGRFVIICTGRVGSNMLTSYLNSNPAIVVKGEIFSQHHLPASQVTADFDVKRYLESEAFHDYPPNINAVGFKLFYTHAKRKLPRAKEVWKLIETDRSIKIIHLTRENGLRAYLSKAIADKTKKWTQAGIINDIATNDKRMHLNYDDCLNRFVQVENWQNEAISAFSNHDVLHVTYEQITANPEESLHRIQVFLNVEPQGLKSFHTRQNPEKLTTLIENYAELKEKFADTAWSRFFYE